MGAIRNGARSFLDGAREVCKFSRMNGFRSGLVGIVGAEEASTLLTAFEPFCQLVDLLIATDNFFNQIDTKDDDGDGEDSAPA